MSTRVVTTQAEWDALPESFPEYTEIKIRSTQGVWISIHTSPKNATVTAYGSATVRAYDSATVTASGSATVTASGSATVTAYGSATVTAYGSATVTASGSATVTASGSATVTAYDSATVTASDSAGVHCHADGVTTILLGFAVAWAVAKKAKITAKSATATIIRPITSEGASAWLEGHGIELGPEGVILFKKVSAKWQTQEGTANETLWTPGATVTHPAWEPERQECGPGKFHACPEAFFCDEFRNATGDRYVAIRVAVADLFAWPGRREYPHKIAFRSGAVLHEVDVHGRKIESK